MQIMESRQSELEWAMAGLNATGEPLVQKTGAVLGPAGFGDDIGTYLYIPYLARWLQIDLNMAVDVFYYGLCFAAFAVSLTYVFLCFNDSSRRLIALGVGLYALKVCFAGVRPHTDVYLINFCAPLLLLPLVLWVLRPGVNKTEGLTAVLLIIAPLIAFIDFARSNSAAPVTIFTLVALAQRAGVPWRRRFRDIAIFMFALGFGVMATTALIVHRDRYLNSVDRSYHPVVTSHPLWHSIYIGLAYLPNNYGIPQYSDSVASAFVRTVDPAAGYLSPRYESILRDEVVRIAMIDPMFMLKTLYAKFSQIVSDTKASLILFVFGLLGGIRDPDRRGFDVGLVLALGAAMAPGLLVWPAIPYYLGVRGVCVIAALIGVVRVLSFGLPGQEKLFNKVKDHGLRHSLELRMSIRRRLFTLARQVSIRMPEGYGTNSVH
ncbi:MAG: hypothetical protein WCF85_16490 [Rhodospirillaceae bacterium]